jgi:hypothetical protein
MHWVPNRAAARLMRGGSFTALGEGEEELVSGPPDQFEDDAPVLPGGGDVQEDHLVCALPVVALGEGDGVPRVPEIDEVAALHDPAVF